MVVVFKPIYSNPFTNERNRSKLFCCFFYYHFDCIRFLFGFAIVNRRKPIQMLHTKVWINSNGYINMCVFVQFIWRNGQNMFIFTRDGDSLCGGLLWWLIFIMILDLLNTNVYSVHMYTNLNNWNLDIPIYFNRF